MTQTLLFVEDEPAIAKGVIRGLESAGFTVRWVKSAEEGDRLFGPVGIDLVLLDVRLPGMDGFTFCRSIRDRGISVPVIMLTARDEEVDRVMGLEIGADDYIVKPFSLRELTARVRSHLRRAYGEYAAPDSPDVMAVGPVNIARSTMRVTRGEREIFLTPTEYRLLLALVENSGTIMTRSVLIERVWGEGFALEDDRTVDVHIRHIREKIEEDPTHPVLIETVRGYGYRCVAKP